MKRFWIITIMILSVTFAVAFHIDSKKDMARECFIEAGIDYPKNHIRAIDFKRPVYIHRVKKGDVFIQYQFPGRPQGNYYALDGATPSELGILEIGYNSDDHIPIKKEKRYYIAVNDFDVLASYAAPMVDDWSTPGDETQTKGSKQQFFTSCKECFKIR